MKLKNEPKSIEYGTTFYFNSNRPLSQAELNKAKMLLAIGANRVAQELGIEYTGGQPLNQPAKHPGKKSRKRR